MKNMEVCFQPDYSGQDDEGLTSKLFNFADLKSLGGLKAGDLLAVDPQIYTKFMKHLSGTVKRDEVTKNLAFLTGLSAYTTEPINLFLRGETSSGKTYNVRESLKYFPKEDVWLLGGLSKTALVHSYGTLVDSNGEPILPIDKLDKESSEEEKEAWRNRLKDSYFLVELAGKILVFLEAPSYDTFMALRPILSHDAEEISYRFTDKTGNGQLHTQHVVIKGWPATVFCSNTEKYIQDLATRSLTATPETAQDKILDANIHTGDKAASPWKFQQDFDFTLLEGYVRFFKNHAQELKAVAPFGMEFARVFPSRFPRAMRDFKRILSLIMVSALFHFAQRPRLVLKTKTEPQETEYYVICTKRDYEFVMSLWREISETTETSASKQILTFFHEVVEEVAKLKPEFLIEDLTDMWNGRFQDRKSSHVTRKWVDFLCDAGYMTKEPDPSDRRQNRLKIIKSEKCGNYVQNDLSAIFTVDLFNAWLDEPKQTWTQTDVSLRESGISNDETTAETVYNRFFSSGNNENVHVELSGSEASSAEIAKEIADKQERTHFPHFEVDDVLSLKRLTHDFQDTCAACGFKGRMGWQVTKYDNSWVFLCGSCGDKLDKKQQEAN
jgi:transcription elongation factor Elf1